MEKGVGEPENTPIDPKALTPVVDETEIAEIVSAWTGIAVSKTDETEAETLINLEANLHERVIGQDEAVKSSFLAPYVVLVLDWAIAIVRLLA